MEVPPPSDVTLSALYPDKASARAYVRTTQRRIKDLSQQLVSTSTVIATLQVCVIFLLAASHFV